MNSLYRYITHRLSCQDATRLISQLRDRPATLTERVKLGLHLRVCEACARFERQIDFVEEAMRRYRR